MCACLYYIFIAHLGTPAQWLTCSLIMLSPLLSRLGAAAVWMSSVYERTDWRGYRRSCRRPQSCTCSMSLEIGSFTTHSCLLFTRLLVARAANTTLSVRTRCALSSLKTLLLNSNLSNLIKSRWNRRFLFLMLTDNLDVFDHITHRQSEVV